MFCRYYYIDHLSLFQLPPVSQFIDYNGKNNNPYNIYEYESFSDYFIAAKGNTIFSLAGEKVEYNLLHQLWIKHRDKPPIEEISTDKESQSYFWSNLILGTVPPIYTKHAMRNPYKLDVIEICQQDDIYCRSGQKAFDKMLKRVEWLGNFQLSIVVHKLSQILDVMFGIGGVGSELGDIGDIGLALNKLTKTRHVKSLIPQDLPNKSPNEFIIKKGGGTIKASDPSLRAYDRPTRLGSHRAHPFGPGLGSADPFTLYVHPDINLSLMARFENLFRKDIGGVLKYEIIGTSIDTPTKLIWRWKPKGCIDWALDLTLDLSAPPSFIRGRSWWLP